MERAKKNIGGYTSLSIVSSDQLDFNKKKKKVDLFKGCYWEALPVTYDDTLDIDEQYINDEQGDMYNISVTCNIGCQSPSREKKLDEFKKGKVSVIVTDRNGYKYFVDKMELSYKKLNTLEFNGYALSLSCKSIRPVVFLDS